MNELIPITEMDGTQLINARDLHGFLQVGRDFSSWIKDRIEKYGFIEDEDFFKESCSPNLAKNRDTDFSPNLGKIYTDKQTQESCSPNLGSKIYNGWGGHNKLDYFLTLDMAKELAMVENNEEGRRIRRYFIRIEKKIRKVML